MERMPTELIGWWCVPVPQYARNKFPYVPQTQNGEVDMIWTYDNIRFLFLSSNLCLFLRED